MQSDTQVWCVNGRNAKVEGIGRHKIKYGKGLNWKWDPIVQEERISWNSLA